MIGAAKCHVANHSPYQRTSKRWSSVSGGTERPVEFRKVCVWGEDCTELPPAALQATQLHCLLGRRGANHLARFRCCPRSENGTRNLLLTARPVFIQTIADLFLSWRPPRCRRMITRSRVTWCKPGGAKGHSQAVKGEWAGLTRIAVARKDSGF